MLKVFDYKGSPIQFEIIDGQVMANATTMAKVFPKKNLSQWVNALKTKEYVDALKAENPIIQNYIIAKPGGIQANGGTWIHQKLILDLARWLDPVFSVWCDERVAELLRTGKTEIKPSFQLPDFTNPVEAARAWADQVEEKMLAERRVKELEPKAEYTDAVLNSETLITTTLIAKDLGISAKRLNAFLHAVGVQFKQGNTWFLYSKYQGKGYMHTKTHHFLDSKFAQQTSHHSYWTEKGRKFIVDLYTSQNVTLNLSF